MSRQPELQELRQMMANSTTEVEIPKHVADSARFAFETMVSEAAEYGLSEADVIRAIFRPVFRKEKGCDCYTCKARRVESDDEHTEGQNRVRVPID